MIRNLLMITLFPGFFNEPKPDEPHSASELKTEADNTMEKPGSGVLQQCNPNTITPSLQLNKYHLNEWKISRQNTIQY